MYKKRTQSKRHDSLSSKGALPEVTTFGERSACDFIIISKARTEGRNNVVLVVRDEFSGLIRAFATGVAGSGPKAFGVLCPEAILSALIKPLKRALQKAVCVLVYLQLLRVHHNLLHHHI